MARDDEYDDNRVVVIEREKGTNGMGMFLLGLAIGAGAALLFAPASGADTRRRLQHEARRARRTMNDMTDAFGDTVADTVADSVENARADLERAVAESKRAYADSRRAYREHGRRQGPEDTRASADKVSSSGEKSADTPGEG